MSFVCVAGLDEVPTGEGRVFRAGDLAVLLVRVGDTIHAVQTRCPHRDCDWSRGRLEGEVLTCPACRFRYSVRTGLNPLTAACHVNQSTAEYHFRRFPEGHAAVHEVRIEEGRVSVSAVPRPFRKVVG